MPDRPVIFLSSTWDDLQGHRKLVLFTLSKLHRWVEAMEYFGARSGAPLEESLLAVRRSHVYVGIIGTRYGSRDAAGVSITQREYEEAYRGGKTILIHLIDQEAHPVLPKFVDTGEDALRLARFKKVLEGRHTCMYFSSAQDLAINVGVDLIKLFGKAESATDANSRDFTKQMPSLFLDAGYTIGMDPNVIDLSGVLEMDNGGALSVRDPLVREVAVAGYLAMNISRGKYDVLRGILTFDRTLWSLLVILVRHYGVNAVEMGKFIEECRDPMQFRLLVALAGELALAECAEPICMRMLLGPDLDYQFGDLRQQAAPVRKVVGYALASMPPEALAVIERYIEMSRKMRRWRQKKAFEFAADTLRKRNRVGKK